MVSPKDFIEPQDIEIEGQKFTYSRVPAFQAAEIYDKIIENKGIIPQAEKLQLLGRCCVSTENGDVVLDKPILIDTYIKKFQTLHALVDKMFEYNFSFFNDGKNSQE